MTNLENYYKSIASVIGYKRNSSHESNTIQNNKDNIDNILTNADDEHDIHKGGTKDSKKSTDDIPLNVIIMFNKIGKKQVDEFLENKHLKQMYLNVYYKEAVFKVLKNLPNEYINNDDYTRLVLDCTVNDIKSNYTCNHILISKIKNYAELINFNNVLERLNSIYNYNNIYFLNFDIESMFKYVNYNYFEDKITPNRLLNCIIECYTKKLNDNHDIKLYRKDIIRSFKMFKKFSPDELSLIRLLAPLFDEFIYEDDVGYMHVKFNSKSYVKFLDVNLSNIEETLQNIILD